MAHDLHIDKHSLPIAVATDMAPRFPVKAAGTNIPLVSPVATSSDVPFGVTNNATYVASSNALPSPGRDKAAVYFSQNSVKVRCNSSVGAMADVAVSSINGGVGASGIIVASGHWIIGQTLEAAGAGDIVTIFINPRKA
jgi:hypothetical protein